MKGPMLEKSHLPAQNVKAFTNDGNLKTHERLTLEKSQLCVQCVTIHLLKVVLCRCMKGPTLERSHLAAQNVIRHSSIVVI